MTTYKNPYSSDALHDVKNHAPEQPVRWRTPHGSEHRQVAQLSALQSGRLGFSETLTSGTALNTWNVAAAKAVLAEREAA